jgi:hypothetical protein
MIDKDTMDHEAAREELELAAVEPGGLERMMAGDTATAQAVAAHLAGCPSCSDEAARLQRSAALIRRAAREMPTPDLKARTIAAIRAEGVPRPLRTAAAGTAAAGSAAVPEARVHADTGPDPLAQSPVSSPTPHLVPVTPSERRRVAPVVGWAATVAAAVVLSVAATWLLVGAGVDGRLASQAESISDLEEVTTATLTVTAEADAKHVRLASVSDPKLDGSLAYSPSTAELVVVATGLKPPPQGLEYRCWVEVAGTRHRVGKMFFSQGLAYWVGPAPAVSGLSSGATFGVSLVGAAAPAIDTEPVLRGSL